MKSDRKLFYIIYKNVERKYPDLTRDEVRAVTIGLLIRRRSKK